VAPMSGRRKFAVYGLVFLATLLLIVSSFTVWTKRQLLNTNAWTNSSVEVLNNDQVRAALSNRVVDLLYQRVDVQGELRASLPEQAKPVAPAAAAALQTAAVRTVDTLLAAPRVQDLWERANRRAHTAIVRVLEGKPVRGVSTANGTVTLDLRPIVDRLADRLGVGDRLRENVPPTAGQIVLLKSDQLEAAQNAVQILRVLSVFIVFAVLALYALAIYLARGHRRTVLEVCGASMLFSGLIVIVIRRLVGNALVDSLVSTEAGRQPVRAIWFIETELLRDIGIALIVYGTIAIVAGWLGGPTRPATAIRRVLAPTFRERPLVVYAVAATIFLIVIAWGPTTADRRLIGVALLAGLFGLGIEVWRRQTIREFPAGGEGPEEPAYEGEQKPALTAR
jgi:hypothetical protein